MESFQEEMEECLRSNGLPAIDFARPDGWIHFHHLCVKAVENCPLEILSGDQVSTIKRVTVHFEFAKHPIEDEMPFKVTWTITDKDGKTGEIFVINSF
jgi:hypothetical protein